MVLTDDATVDGLPGLMRTRADGTLIWESEADGSVLARLLRRALVHGGLACRLGAAATTVRVRCLYYDAERRRVVAELDGSPAALS